MRGSTRASRLAFAGLLGASCWALTAGAHIVYGRPSLLTLVGGAQKVARVRVTDPAAVAVSKPTGSSRPVVEVELLEVLKGDGKAGERLRFALHGHGVAQYTTGDEALVFLVPIERSRELATLHAAGIRWVSFQEHDARYPIEPASGERLLRAVRGYVAAGASSEPDERLAGLRRVTIDLIRSGDSRMGIAAVQDVAASPDARPLLTAEDAPLLVEQVVKSASAPSGVRLALLAELERRGWVEGAPLWLDLLGSTTKPERLQVVRAAGRHPSPEVDAALAKLLAGDDAELAEAAALALGAPTRTDPTPVLVGALERPEARVRRAAIRSLGSIGSPAAVGALESAAESHPDPDVRRRAAAEARKRTR